MSVKRIKREVIPFLPVVLIFLVRMFFLPIIVSGESMEPAFHDGQLLFLSRYPDEIARYDVVVLSKHAENGPERVLIKRVIGLPGDMVEITLDGKVLVNGEDLDGKYQKEEMIVKEPVSITVSEGHIYVLGDNRNHSGDSRLYGEFLEQDVIGKIISY